MKLRLTFLLLLGYTYAIAQTLPAKQQKQIDSVFQNYARPNSPGVSVMIVKDGKTVFKRGYGMANLEYDVPVTPATVFDIASVSKQFTGYAISTLIQQGKISPDDDIHKYLPEVPQFNKPITIRNLIHHTSGLRDWPATLHAAGWRWDESFSYDDIMRMVSKQHDLDFEPGSRYSYSNTGYNLLAAIVTKVGGMPFGDWIAANIFKPLEMTHSQVLKAYNDVIKNFAGSYYEADGKYHKSNDALTAYGSSSIVTSTEDLAKWVIFFQEQLDKKDPVVMRMTETDTFTNGGKNNYAYGLEIGNFNGMRNISHTGGWAGFSTIIVNFPDQKLSIILLANTNSFDSYGTGYRLAGLLLNTPAPAGNGDKLSKAPDVKVDTNQLKKYTGTYKLGNNWYVTFTLENGNLMVQANGEPKFPTEMKTDSSLWVKAYGSSVTFAGITDQAAYLWYRGINAKRIIPIKVSAADLEQYTGSYYSPELEATYRFTVEKGKLTCHHMRLGDFAIDADIVELGKFSSENGVITFTSDTDHKVTGFKLTNGRIQNIVFNKL